MIFEWISNIPQILYKHEIRHVIISPGSRSAPLTLSFTRARNINKHVIPDERSAGYIALGIALSTDKPVAMICTSGTAVANLYPAIIEAYYQKVPLLIITADRPPELIDKGDGQTIRQEDIFRNHIKKSYSLPVPDDPAMKDVYHHMIHEAADSCNNLPYGPVHMNIPLREPLYPDHLAVDTNSDAPVVRKEEVHTPSNTMEMISSLPEYKKILIITGQGKKNDDLSLAISALASQLKIPVVAEVISNVKPVDDLIVSHDLFLQNDPDQCKDLQPELIISIGGAIISKSLKILLRNSKANHWHISEAGRIVDVFFRKCQVIREKPVAFFKSWLKNSGVPDMTQKTYYDTWHNTEKATRTILRSYLVIDKSSEMAVVKIFFESVPHGSIFHLGNSMPVRWANYCQSYDHNFEFFSNRGTSGIDGCVSTAVGVAMTTSKLNFLLVGDMTFFYDRNGLWHNHIPSNLRIIILNNHGGGIFRMIDGPSDQPEIEEYFVTKQKLTAQNTAKDFNLEYYFCSDHESLRNNLKPFMKDNGSAKILEMETSSEINKRIFNELKSKIKKIWN